MRRDIGKATNKQGYTLKYDLALLSEHYYKLVEATRNFIKQHAEFTDKEKSEIIVAGSGRVGTGDLHLKVCLVGYED